VTEQCSIALIHLDVVDPVVHLYVKINSNSSAQIVYLKTSATCFGF